MKFYIETKSYVKIHCETKEGREISLSSQEVREVYSETKCYFDWKKKKVKNCSWKSAYRAW